MADKSWTDQARGALGRYRVMAYVTGAMLLLLTLHVVLQLAQFASDSSIPLFDHDGLSVVIPNAGVVVPIAHGWIYVVYLVTVLDLWSKVRWGFGRLATMVLAGVVPVMSFVLERRVHADALAQIAAGGPAGGQTLRAADAAH